MKLTDPEVIEHLKGNYYIRREKWEKGIGYYWDGKRIWMVCFPFENVSGFSLSDIEAEDWVLCPKE